MSKTTARRQDVASTYKKREKIDKCGCVTVEYPYYVFDAPNTRGSVCAERE